ncbi:CMD domain protein [Variovorax sp. dw_308]|uniref:CMD domain protein n=1 Tax=Variovorax sp. dw_308 TaxID=2721546 RepID=UPI001C469D5F|nr:CMD domain protein [Variovorax sp. dw_308]
MTTPHSTPDVIDQLAGIVPGHALDATRAGRAQARIHSQQSYLALFEPASPPPADGFTLVQRFAVATFVALLHGQSQATRFYADGLASHGASRELINAIAAEAAAGDASGPYGRYPEGPLSVEDAPGLSYGVSKASAGVLGAKLSAALVHAHLLVFHPRDASAQALQALLDAGWSETDIVTLSQLVSFLAFQLRVVVGLQALKRSSDDDEVAASSPAAEALAS